MRKYLPFAVFCIIFAVQCAREPGVRTVNFEESMQIFPNPERGFYRPTVLPELQSLPDLRSEAVTLIYGKVRANESREKDLPGEFLKRIENGFNVARSAGVKVIFCLSYGDRIGDPDASRERIFRHIDQLRPIWERHKDVIDLVKAGFIGPWGEWHSSTHGLETVENRRAILFKILEALPADRMVVLRSPRYKRAIFEGEMMTLERAFDGSNLARTGFHNDCFLSSDDDVGTYRDEESREAGLAYIGNETRFTPFGGETCRLHEYGDCDNSIREMEILHLSWLNDRYQPKVLNHWTESGCMDEIKRRIGYRFVLRNAGVSRKARPGGLLAFGFALENVGFTSPSNPRLVELVLRHNGTGAEETAEIDADPRWWFPGKLVEVSGKYRLPANLPEGDYSILLRLPDPADTLYRDPRYSIRLANTGVWDERTGSNLIYDGLTVSARAGGTADEGATRFEAIGD